MSAASTARVDKVNSPVVHTTPGELLGRSGGRDIRVWMRPSAMLALITLFVSSLTLPLLRWFVSGSHITFNENRNPAPAPNFRADTLQSLPAKIDAYYNDHVGFRQHLVMMASELSQHVPFSTQHQVVVGKASATGEAAWLYFSANGIIEDRLGLTTLSNAQLEAWRRYLERRAFRLAERGILYRFVAVPEKSTIQSEFLPDYIRNRPAGTTRLDQLITYLRSKRSPVRVIDLRNALLRAKSEGYVYDPYDTHWNGRGSFTAYREIVEELHTTFPELKPQELGRDYRLRPSFESFQDLRLMLGLPRAPSNVPVLERIGTRRTHLVSAAWPSDVKPAVPPKGAFALNTVGATRRLLVFHDSFFKAAVADEDQPLAAHFSRSYFCWHYPTDDELMSFVDQENPSVVLEEEVERALPDIRFDPSLQAITPRLKRSAEVTTYALETIGGVAAPRASVIARNFRTTITGWAVDTTASAAASGVEILVDNLLLPAAYGYSRTDVANILKCPACVNSGFDVDIPRLALPIGSHRLAIRVISNDRRTYTEATFGRLEVR